jgi:hypothetical protein
MKWETFPKFNSANPSNVGWSALERYPAIKHGTRPSNELKGCGTFARAEKKVWWVGFKKEYIHRSHISTWREEYESPKRTIAVEDLTPSNGRKYSLYSGSVGLKSK